MNGPCLCGDTACSSCGPAQGYCSCTFCGRVPEDQLGRLDEDEDLEGEDWSWAHLQEDVEEHGIGALLKAVEDMQRAELAMQEIEG